MKVSRTRTTIDLKARDTMDLANGPMQAKVTRLISSAVDESKCQSLVTRNNRIRSTSGPSATVVSTWTEYLAFADNGGTLTLLCKQEQRTS